MPTIPPVLRPPCFAPSPPVGFGSSLAVIVSSPVYEVLVVGGPTVGTSLHSVQSKILYVFSKSLNGSVAKKTDSFLGRLKHGSSVMV